MGKFQLTTAKNSVANQMGRFRQNLPVLEVSFGPPALLYDPTRCDTPLVKTQWVLDFYRDKPSSLLRSEFSTRGKREQLDQTTLNYAMPAGRTTPAQSFRTTFRP